MRHPTATCAGRGARTEEGLAGSSLPMMGSNIAQSLRQEPHHPAARLRAADLGGDYQSRASSDTQLHYRARRRPQLVRAFGRRSRDLPQRRSRNQGRVSESHES